MAATLPDRVKYYTNWRVDPLHTLSLGLVSVKAGDKPYLQSYKSGVNQYEIKEASDLFRILVYAGVYADNPSCNTIAIESYEILLNRIISYDSLLMGLTEWWRLVAGMCLFDRNKIGEIKHHIDPEVFNIIGSMTQRFSMRPPERAPCIWHGGNKDNYDTITLVKTALAITDDDWVECWYGGIVPWWYVKGIIEKFGFGVQLKCPSKQEYDVGLSDYDNMIGYFLKKENCGALDLAMLTSATRYDVKVKNSYYPWFTIYTPNKNARNQGVHWTSWYYNFLNDSIKEGTRGRTYVPKPELSNGVVELNTIVYATSRCMKGYAHPQCFVTDQNRWLRNEDYSIADGLLWPDPLTTWLKEGAIKIAPHLLRADIVGAAGEALQHITDTLMEWIRRKAEGTKDEDDSFRE